LKVRFSHLPHFVAANPNIRVSSCLRDSPQRELYLDLSTGFSGAAKASQSQRSWRTRLSKTAYRLVIHPDIRCCKVPIRNRTVANMGSEIGVIRA
jgi:hypothetical protein